MKVAQQDTTVPQAEKPVVKQAQEKADSAGEHLRLLGISHILYGVVVEIQKKRVVM